MQYVRLVGAALEADDRRNFAEAVLRQARDVAEAAGGVLGLGSKVSAAESAVLERLAREFDLDSDL